jgi:Domain of unknown function (DUF4280)
MAQLVTSGAVMMCSFGVAPATLNVLPVKMITAGGPVANIQDHIPMANIPTFGVCTTPTNPPVATAQAAGSPGAPCVPITSAPWTPGVPTVLVKGQPALDSNSKCMCQWGGVISINSAGQFTVTVG